LAGWVDAIRVGDRNEGAPEGLLYRFATFFSGHTTVMALWAGNVTALHETLDQ